MEETEHLPFAEDKEAAEVKASPSKKDSAVAVGVLGHWGAQKNEGERWHQAAGLESPNN